MRGIWSPGLSGWSGRLVTENEDYAAGTRCCAYATAAFHILKVELDRSHKSVSTQETGAVPAAVDLSSSSSYALLSGVPSLPHAGGVRGKLASISCSSTQGLRCQVRIQNGMSMRRQDTVPPDRGPAYPR